MLKRKSKEMQDYKQNLENNLWIDMKINVLLQEAQIVLF